MCLSFTHRRCANFIFDKHFHSLTAAIACWIGMDDGKYKNGTSILTRKPSTFAYYEWSTQRWWNDTVSVYMLSSLLLCRFIVHFANIVSLLTIGNDLCLLVNCLGCIENLMCGRKSGKGMKSKRFRIEWGARREILLDKSAEMIHCTLKPTNLG